MPKPNIIAIDGPASSGKSTVAQALARQLGYLYFDTGVMYRAVTWGALEQGISIDDEDAVTQLAQTIRIDIHPLSKEDGRQYDVLVDERDVTWEIRSAEVERFVSPVSAYAGVRKAMSAQQRLIGLRGNVVMAGRDIGTVVLPEADLKIYLDASVEERARRRTLEKQARGEEADYTQILAGLQLRDQIDSTRAVAPLRPADDAVIIDTDNLSAAEVIAKVLELCQ